MAGIVEKAEKFSTDLLSNELDPNYLYHNLKHTQRVVKSSRELIAALDLNDEDTEALLLTAWLHDTGYTRGSDEHEEKSAKIAEEFLSKEGYPKDDIKKIQDLILATKRYYSPVNLLEEIIRDADASHFGKKSYMETCEHLRKAVCWTWCPQYHLK